MVKVRKPREEIRKAIAVRIRAGKDLAAKVDIAERTAGYRDWLALFAAWREDTIAVLDTLYKGKDIGRENAAFSNVSRIKIRRQLFQRGSVDGDKLMNDRWQQTPAGNRVSQIRDAVAIGHVLTR